MWPFSTAYPELSASHVGVSLEDKASLGDGFGVYDYIVVGGGTAGCVLASRLSEDPQVTVLLVERGVLADTWASRVPLLSSDFSKDSAPAYKWKTVPQQHANGHEFQIVAGKALGGTSRINSMLYTRGAPAEWNAWNQAGRKGWGYDDMASYFLKSEKAADRLKGEHHGRNGMWYVKSLDGWSFSFWPRVIKAAAAFGFPSIEDVNDPSEPVVGSAQIHRTQDLAGRRHATSTAFLPQKLVLERKTRLKICTGTIATKIDVVSSGEKLKAVGIYLQSDSGLDGKTYYARAKREIIVSSGTFGSPHLLLLSGIGPKAHLEEHGIATVKDLPGVGEHLMDHIGVPLSWKVPLKDSLHAIQASVWVGIVQLLQYLVHGTGFFLLPVSQVALLVRTALLSPTTTHLTPAAPVPPSTVSPDLDAHNPTNIADVEILPVPLNLNPATTFTTREGVFSFLCILVQPKSTGSVRLASSDPRIRPLTDLGTFSVPEDVSVLRKALKLALALAHEMRVGGWTAMQDYELPSSQEDSVLDEFIRHTAQTEYHYSSTCRMAPEDDDRPGVVDDELKVHGVDGLRVADASIFPSILATHTQAPVVVVAEKCADMIRRERRL